jgi:hypothetical protein
MHCLDECDEHAYCDRHFKELLDEAFESGKKEGLREGKDIN